MTDGLTNLLPIQRQHMLVREYYLRLGVVMMMCVIVLTVAAAALLVPAYVFLTVGAHTKQDFLATMIPTLSDAESVALSARLTALSDRVATLTALSSTPSASGIVRSVLALPRPGIALSSFAYTQSAGKNPGTLELSGTAETREVLRNYQLILENAPFILSAKLPVSTYTKDTNLTFTVTLALKP